MSSPSIDELTRSSSFVFSGTVVETGASNLVAVDPRDDLVLIRVDRALRVDPALGDVRGKTVTVETPNGDELQPVRDTRPVSGLLRDRQSPLWAQADLDVLATLEGDAEGKRLFFPTSDSHHWYEAPRFTPGQRGVIVLHAHDPLAGNWLDGVDADVVTALDPADAQPESELEHVRALLAGEDA